jgi:hypothetical protein
MPLVRLPNRKLLYFVHVPKCAGTAVERYLEVRFGNLGMYDPDFGRRSITEAWCISPPQHMPEAIRRDLLPNALLDAVFSTVRHPATRLRSIFLFQKHIEQAIPKFYVFEDWIKSLPRTLSLDPYALHGHLRPSAEQVPMGACVFRVEDELDALIDWLDLQAEEETSTRTIAKENVTAQRVGLSENQIPTLSRSVNALIAEIYSEDYERFGYEVEPPGN